MSWSHIGFTLCDFDEEQLQLARTGNIQNWPTTASTPLDHGRPRCFALSTGCWIYHFGLEWSQRWCDEISLSAILELRALDLPAIQLQPTEIVGSWATGTCCRVGTGVETGKMDHYKHDHHDPKSAFSSCTWQPKKKWFSRVSHYDQSEASDYDQSASQVRWALDASGLPEVLAPCSSLAANSSRIGGIFPSELVGHIAEWDGSLGHEGPDFVP